MSAAVTLCQCGHVHFSGSACWCGCTIFAPDVEDEATDVEAELYAAEDDSDYPLGEVSF